MGDQVLHLAMNGVTGRMGYRQHLVRSVLAIRDQGGVRLSNGDTVQLEPVLVGRDPRRMERLARDHGIDRWSTDLGEVLDDKEISLYFDAQITHARVAALRAAIAAGKDVFTEKPIAESFTDALELARLAAGAGVRHGVVHDKVYLPGLLKLRRLIDGGFFGRILSIRGEFGYWVFEGDWQPAQRPSWNYRAEDGGGITVDMFCHWSYVLENLFGRVEAVTAKVVTHLPERYDELGKPYTATADDAAYGIFELEGGIVAQLNSSWCVRVDRDELVEFQVDGTEGSAVAGLRNCRTQHRAQTPRPVWNPDLPERESFRTQWVPVPDNGEFDNGFKAQWEQFVRSLYGDADHPYDFFAGARGVLLAEEGLRSSVEGRRVVLPRVEA